MAAPFFAAIPIPVIRTALDYLPLRQIGVLRLVNRETRVQVDKAIPYSQKLVNSLFYYCISKKEPELLARYLSRFPETCYAETAVTLDIEGSWKEALPMVRMITTKFVQVVSIRPSEERKAPLRFEPDPEYDINGAELSEYLTCCSRLHSLSLHKSPKVTAADLHNVSWPRTITRLQLNRSNIDEQGLLNLCRRLPHLREIHLQYASFSDRDSIAHLTSLQSLQIVDLTGSTIDSLQAATLVKTLPRLCKLILVKCLHVHEFVSEQTTQPTKMCLVEFIEPFPVRAMYP